MNNYKNTVLLNSGRNCLRYIIKANNIKDIYLPFYICQSVRYAIKCEKAKMHFYHIDKNFMPIENFSSDSYILYPNYFGICTKQNKLLTKKYKHLISDNAHALYARPSGFASFYSPRKFINVNDGGILITKKLCKEDFPEDFSRNIKIHDYETFCKNELSIDDEPIRTMSLKTQNELKQFNYIQEALRRKKIFKMLHNILGEYNETDIELAKEDIPYVYPFLSEKSYEIGEYLTKHNIFLLSYGTNLPKDYTEYELSKKLLLIPLKVKICNILKSFILR